MRDAAINLRAHPEQRALIDSAAEVVGKSRSDFMLEAACERAQGVLLDEWYGFHPYTPWSTTTTKNPYTLLLQNLG